MEPRSRRASGGPAWTAGDRAARTADGWLGAAGALAGAGLFALVRGADTAWESAAWGAAWESAAWWFALAGYGGFGCCSVLLARADLAERRLPNTVIALGTAWTLSCLVAATVAGAVASPLAALPASALAALLAPVLAAVGCFGVALLAWLVWPGWLGAGDVKLVPLAAFAGVWGARSGGGEAAARFAAFALVGLALAGCVALARRDREAPAGPFLLAASWATLLT